VYLSIFTKTAAALALTVFLAAQTLDWSDKDTVIASSTIVAFGLLGAVIGGLIAVLWAFAGTPAVTAVGKALRSAVQALLALPIAGVVLNETSDFVELEKLVIPTVAAVVLAFLVSYLSNRNPVPTVEGVDPGADFIGTSDTPPA
jgi:hypothetical protein